MAVPHRTTLALALALALLLTAGCGSNPHSGTQALGRSCSPFGFVNQTGATDAELAALWQGAQQQIATQPIPMNPVTSPNNITYASPNPAAAQVQPVCQVTVDAMPNALTPPKAGFQCSQSPTGYCAGITIGSGPWTVEVVEPDLLQSGATGWEFQNIILEKLGYDVSGR